MKRILLSLAVSIAANAAFSAEETAQLKNPPAPFASSEPSKLDRFAGIDFWRADRLHIPNFAASRNLLQNPSFEQGLQYYVERDYGDWGGQDEKVYSVDSSTSFSGKHSLRIKTFKRFQCTSLSSFTIPCIPGKKYIISFYAKSEKPSSMVISLDYSYSADGVRVRPEHAVHWLTTEWKRYVSSFVSPNNAFALSITPKIKGADETSIAWLDGLQIEEGNAPSAFVEPPIAITLLSASPAGHFFKPDERIGASLRISTGAPQTKGEVSFEVTDFFYAKPFSGRFEFKTDSAGEAVVPLPLDGKLGLGVFSARSEAKLENGAAHTEFHRISIMEPAPGNCLNKKLFASFFPYYCSHFNAYCSRLAYLGFGSTNYETSELHTKTLSAHGIKSTGEGVLGYGPTPSVSDLNVPRYKERVQRIKTEPYSEELYQETEKLSYEMAKAYPWIRTWFLEGEAAGRLKILKDGDADGYAKLNLACRAGVLRADPTLKFLFDGGPGDMYPRVGIAQIDRWLTAAGKIAPSVRFDAFAIHPYRPTPEAPDLDADTKLYLKMLESHGYKNEPVYWNEGGYYFPWHVPEWHIKTACDCARNDKWVAGTSGGTPSYHIGWAERLSSAYLARTWLIALKYAQRIKQANNWNYNAIFDEEMCSFANAKIPNTLCRLLGNATFKKDIRFPENSIRCYMFEDLQKRPVAAIWSYLPEVDAGLTQSPVVKISFPGKTPEIFDLMENRVEAQANADGSTEIPISPFPLFLRGNKGSMDALCKSIETMVFPGCRNIPLEMDVSLKDRDSARLTFTNKRNRSFEGVAKTGSMRKELSIPKDGSIDWNFRLAKPVAYDAISVIPIRFEVSWKDGATLAKDLSFRAFAVGKAHGNEPSAWIPLKREKLYPGKSLRGFAAKYSMTWNEQSLFLQVMVKDAKPVFPKSDVDPAFAYKYDSLQIYIDTWGDNVSPGRRPGDDVDDGNNCSFTVFRQADSGKAVVYRELTPDQQLAGGVDAPKANTVDTQIKASVEMTPDGYVYKIEFPNHRIAPLELKAGTFARLALFVNANDGEGRVGGLITTETGEPRSKPEEWPCMILTE